MLRHLVAWNLKPAHNNPETLALVHRELASLKDRVPLVKSLTVVSTAILPRSNRQIMLDTIFEDEAALDAYLIHPEHKQVVEVISHLLDERTVVDYLF